MHKRLTGMLGCALALPGLAGLNGCSSGATEADPSDGLMDVAPADSPGSQGSPGSSGSPTTPTTPPTPPTAGDSAPPAGEPAPGTPTGTPGAAGDGAPPAGPGEPIPEECKGFEVEGLEYSPGGDVLPNTCMPFDTMLNNPYAIRCIDADPSYSTGYPGDEFCILPPPPELGTQVRVGPESYDNVPEGYLMDPGEEFDNYYYVNAPNTEAHYFYRVNLRMRAGSHHMINRMLAEDRQDGWSDSGDVGVGFGGSSSSQGFPGAQRPDQDRPTGTLEVPPENQGLGQRIEANQQFSFNLHHFNLTEGKTLREVWVNIWYKPQEEITDEMGGIALFGDPRDLNIPPGEHRELHYECPVQGNTRIITLNGHRHAWTDRFGVWIERADGAIDNVYESFDYADMPTFQYDTISENPKPDLAMRKDGATSGILTVEPGDTIHFVCDITNGSDQQLRFANEVLTGEMCILFGSRTGDGFDNCRFLTNKPL